MRARHRGWDDVTRQESETMSIRSLYERFKKKLNWKKQVEDKPKRSKRKKRKSLYRESLQVELELDRLRLFDAQLDYIMAQKRIELERKRSKEPYYVR